MRDALRRAVAGGIAWCLFSCLLLGCAGSVVPSHWRRAHLWATASSEYAAVSLQTYGTATQKLEPALADREWTACLEQKQGYQQLPPAIIIDLDETVLDNRPFQLRLIDEKKDFDLEMWNDWVEEKSANAIPGSVDFLVAADALGIEIFYLTNREHSVEKATRERLIELGAPVNEERDTLLSKGERPEWGGEKVARRKLVAATHRVLLIVGDHLRDFVNDEGFSHEERREITFEHRRMWGDRWFMLPNPIYGGWVAALTSDDAAE